MRKVAATGILLIVSIGSLGFTNSSVQANSYCDGFPFRRVYERDVLRDICGDKQLMEELRRIQEGPKQIKPRQSPKPPKAPKQEREDEPEKHIN